MAYTFSGSRYVTSGVAENFPIELQVALFSAVKCRSCLCGRRTNLPFPLSPPIPISQIVNNISNVLQLPFVELFQVRDKLT